MVLIIIAMASAEELQQKIADLEKQLKDAQEEGKKPSLVYSRDRKFTVLSKDVDVLDWIETMSKHVNIRFRTEPERVMFVLEYLDKEAKAELRFRAQVDKATVSEVMEILTDMYQPSETVIQLQQHFYSRNQKDGESIQTYAVELMQLLTRICDIQPSVSVNKEDQTKVC